MREIKFRAWLKRSKEMYQVESLDFEKERAFIYTNDFDLWADFKDIILLQFTGLYDKHGKEIYEGDVLKPLNEHFTYVVKFGNGCFYIEYILGKWNTLERGIEVYKNFGSAVQSMILKSSQN